MDRTLSSKMGTKWGMINQSSYPIPDYSQLVRVFDNIESLIMDTNFFFFLDKKLDEIPVVRGSRLRLQRYAT